MKHIILIALVSVVTLACGKGESKQDVESAPPPLVEVLDPPAVETLDGPAADATEEPTPDIVAAEISPEQQLMDRLAVLEVPDMTRTRSEKQSDHVTLQFTTTTPNALGNTATIEVTIGMCSGCTPTPLAERKAQKEQSLAQIGELHAKNPSLDFAIEDLALAPHLSGALTYVRSFVDDGVTRAAMHTLEVVFVGHDMSVRMLAYPRTPFPATQAELDASFSRDALVAATKAIFSAASAVLWPSP